MYLKKDGRMSKCGFTDGYRWSWSTTSGYSEHFPPGTSSHWWWESVNHVQLLNKIPCPLIIVCAKIYGAGGTDDERGSNFARVREGKCPSIGALLLDLEMSYRRSTVQFQRDRLQ